MRDANGKRIARSRQLQTMRMDRTQHGIAVAQVIAMEKSLTIFVSRKRFFLDIDEAQFYTFFNCNLIVADSM